MPNFRIIYDETITRVEYVKAATLADAQVLAEDHADEGAPDATECDSQLFVRIVEDLHALGEE